MFETTTAQNLLIGRLVWPLLIVAIFGSAWLLVRARQRGADVTHIVVAVIVGIVAFIVVGGAGALIEGALLGMVLGLVTAVPMKKVTRKTAP